MAKQTQLHVKKAYQLGRLPAATLDVLQTAAVFHACASAQVYGALQECAWLNLCIKYTIDESAALAGARLSNGCNVGC